MQRENNIIQNIRIYSKWRFSHGISHHSFPRSKLIVNDMQSSPHSILHQHSSPQMSRWRIGSGPFARSDAMLTRVICHFIQLSKINYDGTIPRMKKTIGKTSARHTV